MKKISSKENPLIKHIVKLKEKKYRNEYCEYLVEGVKLVREAILENAKIKQIIVSKTAENSELFNKYLKEELKKIEYIQIPDSIFKTISEVEQPQGVIAVVEKNTKNYIIDLSQDIILALDDIQDPGNLGTIIRTVDSCGVSQILVSKGTVDSYSSKVIRSTMGAIFRVQIIECENLSNTLVNLKNNNYKIMVTSIEAKKSIYESDLNKKVIVIGNEANGVTDKIINIADEKINIPMLGKTESLNASVATGVILYEYVRRKLNGRK